MKIIWTFTPSGAGHPPPVTREATFHTLAGPDTDGDGVADASDACPSTHGTLANGCLPPVQPDPDSDGVYGAADLCPAVDGQGALNGCPGGVVPPPIVPPVIPDPPGVKLGGQLNVVRNARLPRAGLVKGRKLTLTCTRDATASAVLTIDKKTAKKLHIKTGKAALPIAAGTGACKAAGGGSLKLKLLTKYKRAVQRARGKFPGMLVLSLTAAGEQAAVKTPVKIA
jgi:hypothetical protein